MLGEFDKVTQTPILELKRMGVCPVRWAVYKSPWSQRWFVEFRCFDNFWPPKGRQLTTTLIFDSQRCVCIGKMWYDNNTVLPILWAAEYAHFADDEAKEAYINPYKTSSGKVQLYQINLPRGDKRTLMQMVQTIIKQAQKDVD